MHCATNSTKLSGESEARKNTGCSRKPVNVRGVSHEEEKSILESDTNNLLFFGPVCSRMLYPMPKLSEVGFSNCGCESPR